MGERASSGAQSLPVLDSPLFNKLRTVVDLGEAERAALDAICVDAREMAPRRTIIREGDRPDHIHLIVDGWAARYKLLPDGERQITAFLMPGDFCDLHVTILSEMDHSIATLTRARVAYVPYQAMDRLAESPKLAKALW
ncbi:MAG: Crp/Fnr family transcriptional regulator [Allosphingosinicella sp.]